MKTDQIKPGDMKNLFLIVLINILGTISFPASAQDVIFDYDGNQYHPITIGTQVWLKENMKALHYSDGTEIPSGC